MYIVVKKEKQNATTDSKINETNPVGTLNGAQTKTSSHELANTSGMTKAIETVITVKMMAGMNDNR